MNKILYIVIGVVALVVFTAGGFYAGVTYAGSQPQAANSDFVRQRAVTQAQGQNGSAADPCGFGQDFRNRAQGTNGGNAQGGNAQGGNTQGGGTAQNGGTNAQGTGRQFGGTFGGAFGGINPAQLGDCVARGQIKSVNGSTIEISTAANVVSINVTDGTIISKTDRGSLADLKPGDRVTVFAPTGGDKTTASFIQLQRPLEQQ